MPQDRINIRIFRIYLICQVWQRGLQYCAGDRNVHWRRYW